MAYVYTVPGDLGLSRSRPVSVNSASDLCASNEEDIYMFSVSNYNLFCN